MKQALATTVLAAATLVPGAGAENPMEESSLIAKTLRETAGMMASAYSASGGQHAIGSTAKCDQIQTAWHDAERLLGMPKKYRKELSKADHKTLKARAKLAYGAMRCFAWMADGGVGNRCGGTAAWPKWETLQSARSQTICYSVAESGP